jgi:hypothetical protein
MGVAYISASIPGLYANEAREAARCAEYQLEYKIYYYLWTIVLIPGFACIIGGIMMKWLLSRKRA